MKNFDPELTNGPCTKFTKKKKKPIHHLDVKTERHAPYLLQHENKLRKRHEMFSDIKDLVFNAWGEGKDCRSSTAWRTWEIKGEWEVLEGSSIDRVMESKF